jgi:hypothetical protein
MYSLYSTHTLNQEYKLNSRTAVFTMWVCLFYWQMGTPAIFPWQSKNCDRGPNLLECIFIIRVMRFFFEVCVLYVCVCFGVGGV